MSNNNHIDKFLRTARNIIYCIPTPYVISILFVLMIFLFGVEKVEAKPFVWEVKAANKPGTVYLVGSIHILHSYDTLPTVINTVFSQSEKIMFEADIDDPRGSEIVRSRAYLDPSDSLSNYLQPSTYENLQNFLSARGADYLRLGSDDTVYFNRLKPWFAFLWTANYKFRDTGLSGNYGVDRTLLTRARQYGKPLQFFETFEFQIQTIENALHENENAALSSVLSGNPEELVSAWNSGDYAGLENVVSRGYASYPSAYSILISQRNLNWLPTIEAQLGQNRRTLVVVGAAHMVGTSGLITLLRNRGYSVEQLPAAPRLILQPAGTAAAMGSTVSLTVKATGTPPLAYEWRKNGTNISGATSATYTLFNVQPDDAGSYSVLVSNDLGSIESLPATISIVTSALDYNGYGQNDLVWQQNDGHLAVWFMDNTNLSGSTLLYGGRTVDPKWKVVGVNDFDGDQHNDILWQHTNGSLAVWFINGTALSSSILLNSQGTITSAWRVNGLADLNQTGSKGLVCRNINGKLSFWPMSGTNIIGTITPLNNGQAIPTNWQIAGFADFNGDGKTDILWQSNEGLIYAWLMNGTVLGSSVPLNNGAIVNTNWRISGLADFNQDGQTDLIWRHSTGLMAIWFMNGTTRQSSGYLNNGNPVPTSWKIVAPK